MKMLVISPLALVALLSVIAHGQTDSEKGGSTSDG